MTPLILSAFLLLPIFGFVLGAFFGAKNHLLWQQQVFADLDHLIGMVQEIAHINHDRRIAPGVVTDAVQSIKYSLGLPKRMEEALDEHPSF